MTNSSPDIKMEILNELQAILQETIRLYKTNHSDYEAGRVDGVKWCIEKISDMK